MGLENTRHRYLVRQQTLRLTNTTPHGLLHVHEGERWVGREECKEEGKRKGKRTLRAMHEARGAEI